MIYLEIFFFIAVVVGAIYFAFFSKFAQKLASSAEARNRELARPSDTSADSLASRVEAAKQEVIATSEAIAARKAAVAKEASKLESISANK